jgi:hypothetical protein
MYRAIAAGEGALRRPYGTPEFDLLLAIPTLKRGANKHCAFGAGFGSHH